VSTEEKIKEAAKKIFIKRGYAGARMNDIADELGMNKALLHYYYRSKEKLFEVIFFEVFDMLLPKLKATVTTDLPLRKKIELFVNTYVDAIASNPYVPMFILHELSQDPDRFVEKLKRRNSFPEIGQFILQVIQEMEEKNIQQYHPFHFFMNMISMCAFPFVARPMLQAVSGIGDEHWNEIMAIRKEEVTRFILNAIRI